MFSFKASFCLAAVGGMTAAIKAERALRPLGIQTRISALSPEQTRNGCAFGVEFPCEELARVRRALRAARIPVTEYIEQGGAGP